MILADSAVWVDHINRGDPMLERLLLSESILMHPVVMGEIALGSMPNRSATLKILRDLPRAVAAHDSEVLQIIEDWALYGCGIGFGDAHLLASILLTPATQLWTRDKPLLKVARKLSLATDLA